MTWTHIWASWSCCWGALAVFLLCFGFCQLDGNEPESGQKRKSPRYPVWREILPVYPSQCQHTWPVAVKQPLQLKVVDVTVLGIRRPCSVITEAGDSSDNSRLSYPEEKKASMILPPTGFMAKPPSASKSSGLRHRERQSEALGHWRPSESHRLCFKSLDFYKEMTSIHDLFVFQETFYFQPAWCLRVLILKQGYYS